MRILIITNKPPFPPSDGSSLATSQLITALASNHYLIHIFYLNTSKHIVEKKNIPERTQNISFTTASINTRICYLKALFSLFYPGKPYTVNRFSNKRTRKILKELLRRETFDIMQIEGLSMAQYLPLLREYSKAQIVFRPHNAEYVIWDQMKKTEQNPLKKLYFHLLSHQIKTYEYKMTRQFTALLPISHEDASIFRRWNPAARIMVLPYGIKIPSKPSTSPAPGLPVLLFLGSLDWQPNINGLLWFLKKIWPALTCEFPELTLRIAGRNPDRRLVHTIRVIQKKALTKTNPSHATIDFLGEIETTDSFYTSGSIFIVPLLAGSGIRIKILEAMARQQAIVSTTIGTTGIPARHGQHILIADNVNDFTDTLKNLLKDPVLYTKITRNALLLLQEYFNIDQITKNLGNFYRQL